MIKIIERCDHEKIIGFKALALLCELLIQLSIALRQSYYFYLPALLDIGIQIVFRLPVNTG